MENKDLENYSAEDLEDLREYVEDLLGFLPIAFCAVNPLDFVLEINKFFENLTGYKKIDIIGQKIEKLFLEKEEVKDLIEEIKGKKDKKEKELTLLTKEEKPVPVTVSLLSRESEDGSFIGYFLTITDTSEKNELEKRIEEELKNKEEEIEEKTRQMADSRSALLNILEDVDSSYQEAEKERAKTSAIIENFVDGLLFFDKEGVLSIANSKAEQFFNFKGPDIYGKNLKQLFKISSLNPLIEVISKENEIKDLFREDLKLNDNLHLEVTTTTVKKEDDILGTLIHVHDITREKRIEKIKTEFIAIAAHQLRTPLCGIKWTLGTFLEEIVEENIELGDSKELIKNAYDSNERMIKLVNNLLNVNKIEEGQYSYKMEEVDIFEVINPLVEKFSKLAKQKENLTFRVEKKQKTFPKIVMDKERILLVLDNFLDNAFKYAEKGEVLLSLTKEGDKEIKIAVYDEGGGIPKEDHERVFNKFFRAENITSKDTEGSGLGLFICKNIIEYHNGEIGFDSSEKGTVFYFTLPIKK